MDGSISNQGIVAVNNLDPFVINYAKLYGLLLE